MPFSVLIICTGNISRSPMTELLFRAWSDEQADLIVASAGVAALVGEPMDPGAATVLREVGLDPSRHRARQFTPAMAEQADLVLTAEWFQLERVLEQAPTALRRAFTIKEFARIAAGLAPGEPREVVAAAGALRGLSPRPADPAADDVADPHLMPVNATRSAAAELTAAVRVIVAVLGFAPAERQRRRPLPYVR